MKLATIIGARPQFIKAKPVLDELNKINGMSSVVIHTGQHYDYEMSKLFFDELDIPKPQYNLGIGSGGHGLQTGQMLIKIEDVLISEKPDLVFVYGDTNSTLAGALVAAKLHIPIAHVEAGMRSYNRDMPEEINRVVTDHLSNLLFCATQTAVDNLRKEGISGGIHMVGDTMYDICLSCLKFAGKRRNILNTLNIEPKAYYLATVHRPSNTDDAKNLKNILEAFSELNLPVIFPIHPRTKKYIGSYADIPMQNDNNILYTDPVGYLDMLVLEKNANKILTDSGGIQKEAYFFGVPCITLREETEWIETVESGWNTLTGAIKEKILYAVNNLSPNGNNGSIFGDGKASERICEIIRKS